MPIQFIVSEYNPLWDALKQYERQLQKAPAGAEDEDAQVFVDESLMRLEGMLRSVQAAAKEDWDLELN